MGRIINSFPFFTVLKVIIMQKIDTEDQVSMRIKVFKELENAILSGELKPGESLTEIKVSKMLGVSRTPVREAIRQLELEDLVKSVPNKGAVVVGISEKDVDDIYTIRMYIEGLAAKWAAENISDDECVQLKEILDLQEYYLAKDDLTKIWQLDKQFHAVINSSCRSNPLKHMLSSFHNYLQRARRISMMNKERSIAVIDEHTRIFQSIRDHDAQTAEKVMIEHIKKAKQSYLSRMKAQES